MKLESMTLADLIAMAELAPQNALPARRIMAFAPSATYDQFIGMLNEDLDRAIAQLEEDPKVRLTDGEDRLTTEIIMVLRAFGYRASHDETIGGHSDIVVRGQNE